jgi:hypothetical protein
MLKYHTTTSGVIDVIKRYASKDPALRKALTTEMGIFRNAEGDFGRVTAISDRRTMLPGMCHVISFVIHYASSCAYYCLLICTISLL